MKIGITPLFYGEIAMSHPATYRDRTDAGQQLAAALTGRYAGRDDVLVLGLPRGGVPVAYEVAAALGAPLDVMVVRKLGAPSHKEYAIGAIASGGVTILDKQAIDALQIKPSTLETIAAEEHEELERRERRYRQGRAMPPMQGRSVILVDDGLATGATMTAAVAAVRKASPATIAAAVPVGSEEACDRIRAHVDELVCLSVPPIFRAVGLWYNHFDQTSDEEVLRLLAQRRKALAP